MISVREALETIIREVEPLGMERVPLTEAVGRVLAEDVTSERDVPGYANSAMDGFAMRHADLSDGVRLRIIGAAPAGADPAPAVGAGEAVRIMTGGALPEGADSVVKVEDTREVDGGVEIVRFGPKGTHVRFAGEDLRAGERVLAGGSVLTPAAIGVLASVGRALVLVRRKPLVAVVSTGNELVEPDRPLRKGEVVNSNAYSLGAAVAESGCLPILLPIARDTREEIRATFVNAARCDAILSTGGVSVGDFDYVKVVMDELGVARSFWRVAQKPGKPLTFGTLSSKPYFGLPGNPVSSLLCFYLYARPALRKMGGHSRLHLPVVEATLEQDVRKAEGLTEFVRCRLERRSGFLFAHSTGDQGSGILTSMSRGDGLIIGPAEQKTLAAGSLVRVILLDADPSSTDPPF